MGAVQYVRIEGVPGLHFECERMRARLSTKACASNFEIARTRSLDRHARHACIGCPVGALHRAEERGGEDVAREGVPILSGRRVCPRCLRPSHRIIGRHLCVSCYNRQREVLVGINRHGKRPNLPDPCAVRVMVMDSARVSLLRVERVYSVLEAVVLAARRTGARRFGWCAQQALEAA